MSLPSPPDPTRCPHCGTLAAETLCHVCKRSREDAAAIVRANTYANRMIDADRLERFGGVEYDLDCVGRRLKPGK